MGASTPDTYAHVEKAAWAFVDTLGIPGIARRGEVTRVITEAVMTALMAGEIDARETARTGRPPVYVAPKPQPTPLQVMQDELRRFLDEDLPNRLQKIVGTHVRIGVSQALEAGARSARVDHSPAEEEQRVHMAAGPSNAVESAAARMQRLAEPPILGDAALFAKLVARDLSVPPAPLDPLARERSRV